MKGEFSMSVDDELKTETAETLLRAIRAAAPQAHARSSEGLESLARAYALVATAGKLESGEMQIF